MSDDTPWGPWHPHPDRGCCLGPVDDEVAIVLPPLDDDPDQLWLWATFDADAEMDNRWAPDEPSARAAALASLEARGVPKVLRVTEGRG